jgi:hypothetical protein
MPRPSKYKYVPLAAYLAALSPETMTVTLTLAELERIIKDDLPARARTSAFWTAGRARAHAVWFDAGWRVARVAMRVATPTITFTRGA